jgi:hypothetical protein
MVKIFKKICRFGELKIIWGTCKALKNIRANIKISGKKNLGYEEKQHKGWLD